MKRDEKQNRTNVQEPDDPAADRDDARLDRHGNRMSEGSRGEPMDPREPGAGLRGPRTETEWQGPGGQGGGWRGPAGQSFGEMSPGYGYGLPEAHGPNRFPRGPRDDRDFGPHLPGGYGVGLGGLGTGIGGSQLYGRQAQGFANAPSEAHRDSYVGVGPKNYRRADERIVDAVCERMTMHPDLDASGMEVDVKDGVVTLSGTVRNRRDRWVAEDLVDRVAGVRDIDNRLKVDRG